MDVRSLDNWKKTLYSLYESALSVHGLSMYTVVMYIVPSVRTNTIRRPWTGHHLFPYEPHPHLSLSHSHHPTHVGSTMSSSPLSPTITPLFHCRLKTHLFFKSFPVPPSLSIDTHWTDFTDSRPDSFSLALNNSYFKRLNVWTFKHVNPYYLLV